MTEIQHHIKSNNNYIQWHRIKSVIQYVIFKLYLSKLAPFILDVKDLGVLQKYINRFKKNCIKIENQKFNNNCENRINFKISKFYTSLKISQKRFRFFFYDSFTFFDEVL